jgi:UPF0042 nucleotide-binding protein
MSQDRDPRVQFTVITGLSGAGKSEAAKCLEDLGYFVIDNLPPALIEQMATLVTVPGTKVKQVALVVDVRGGEFFPELEKALDGLADRGIEYRILFLEASDQALVRRYEFTRHRHPLAASERVTEGIEEERNLLARIRDRADVVIDTSNLNVHGLRDKIRGLFAEPAPDQGLAVNVISFGYKHGLPLDADMVMDVRFLPNPHWVDELRPLNGTNRRVRGYVLNSDGADEFMGKLRDLLGFALPGFVREGRHYLTIAVGCTGGKHRSVVIADEIARYLTDKGFPATVVHRDVERE